MLDDLTPRLADRLRALRHERGWSLDTLAGESGLSRATLSRMETGEVSPTAESLGKLCGAYGLAMSRLLMMVESKMTPLVPYRDQSEWQDPDTGFTRRSVSPLAGPLRTEIIEAHIPPARTIRYETPLSERQEHHLVLLDGALTVEVDATEHHLTPGDCLRYLLDGPSAFRTGPTRGARYLLVLT